MAALLDEDLSALPFLAAALTRHLEEYPDRVTGLSRHERQILEMVEAGIHRPGRLFARHQQMEAAPCLGDWGYWNILEQLTNASNPLLQTDTSEPFVRPPQVAAHERLRSQQLRITPSGRAVLAGQLDWVALNPPDRWKGGVHLHPDKPMWRWDTARRALVQPGD